MHSSVRGGEASIVCTAAVRSSSERVLSSFTVLFASDAAERRLNNCLTRIAAVRLRIGGARWPSKRIVTSPALTIDDTEVGVDENSSSRSKL